MECTLVPFEKCDDFEITVSAHPRGGFCFLQFSVRGDLSQLDLPDEGEHIRADNLWEGTCFELFAKSKDSAEYHEYNFASSGDWNLFGFTEYREGKHEVAVDEMDIIIMKTARVFRLSVMLPWEVFENKQCGISTVLKHRDGTESFWALAHGEQPDFHNAELYSVELSPAGVMFNENYDSKRTDGIVDVLKQQNKL